jgi:hypothetical protein
VEIYLMICIHNSQEIPDLGDLEALEVQEDLVAQVDLVVQVALMVVFQGEKV